MEPISLAILGAGALAGGIGNAFSGGMQADAAKRAAELQHQAGDKAMGLTTESYNNAQGYQQPMYDRGMGAFNTMADRAAGGQYDVQGTTTNATPYQRGNFDFQADPGYAFQQQQGQAAVQNSAAARGMGLSPATQKALAMYGTNLANQSYGQSYDRYMQTNQFDRGTNQQNFGQNLAANNQNFGQSLQSAQNNMGVQNTVAGYGAQAAGNLAGMATGYGNNMAGIVGQQANAGAAGIMGQVAGWGNVARGIGDTVGNMAGIGASAYSPTPTTQNYNPSYSGNMANAWSPSGPIDNYGGYPGYSFNYGQQ